MNFAPLCEYFLTLMIILDLKDAMALSHITLDQIIFVSYEM